MERYGLIGHPLKHSQSRFYFNKKFEYEGLGALDEALSADFDAWSEFLEFDKELLSNDMDIIELIARHKADRETKSTDNSQQ